MHILQSYLTLDKITQAMSYITISSWSFQVLHLRRFLFKCQLQPSRVYGHLQPFIITLATLLISTHSKLPIFVQRVNYAGKLLFDEGFNTSSANKEKAWLTTSVDIQ